jgi:hypothetical protein
MTKRLDDDIGALLRQVLILKEQEPAVAEEVRYHLVHAMEARSAGDRDGIALHCQSAKALLAEHGYTRALRAAHKAAAR